MTVARWVTLVVALGTGAAAAQPEEAWRSQQRGIELYRQGNPLGALREFDEQVRLAPEAPWGWYYRGLMKRDLDDCFGALSDFSRALAIQPAFFNALFQRGRCLQRLGDDGPAAEDYTRAVQIGGQLHPRFLAFFARADAYRRLGRLEDALADYTTVLGLRTDTTARRSRAWVYAYLDRWSDAHADMSSYLHDTEGKEPDAIYAAILANLALRRMGRRSDAGRFLESWRSRLDLKAWPAPAFEYLAGRLPEREFLEAAADPRRATEALTYVGVALLGDGDSRGLDLLVRAMKEGDPAFLEYDLAYYDLLRAGRATPLDRKARRIP